MDAKMQASLEASIRMAIAGTKLPQFVGIVVRTVAQGIHINFLYENFSEELKELISVAMTEVYADLDELVSIDFDMELRDHADGTPVEIGFMVFDEGVPMAL